MIDFSNSGTVDNVITILTNSVVNKVKVLVTINSFSENGDENSIEINETVDNSENIVVKINSFRVVEVIGILPDNCVKKRNNFHDEKVPTDQKVIDSVTDSRIENYDEQNIYHVGIGFRLYSEKIVTTNLGAKDYFITKVVNPAINLEHREVQVVLGFVDTKATEKLIIRV